MGTRHTEGGRGCRKTQRWKECPWWVQTENTAYTLTKYTHIYTQTHTQPHRHRHRHNTPHTLNPHTTAQHTTPNTRHTHPHTRSPSPGRSSLPWVKSLYPH